jgi:hypothetical protein
MLEHALEFYKSLFGREDRDNIRLGEEFWQEGGISSRRKSAA